MKTRCAQSTRKGDSTKGGNLHLPRSFLGCLPAVGSSFYSVYHSPYKLVGTDALFLQVTDARVKPNIVHLSIRLCASPGWTLHVSGSCTFAEH
jgi:hypothetical protein